VRQCLPGPAAALASEITPPGGDRQQFFLRGKRPVANPEARDRRGPFTNQQPHLPRKCQSSAPPSQPPSVIDLGKTEAEQRRGVYRSAIPT